MLKTWPWPSRHSSVSWAFAHGARGFPFDSHQCLRRYVDEISSAAMLATKRSAGVASEVNLREHVMLLIRLHQVWIRQNPVWLWNLEETSPEVQNRGISGPTKRTHVLQKLKKKTKKLGLMGLLGEYSLDILQYTILSNSHTRENFFNSSSLRIASSRWRRMILDFLLSQTAKYNIAQVDRHWDKHSKVLVF